MRLRCVRQHYPCDRVFSRKQAWNGHRNRVCQARTYHHKIGTSLSPVHRLASNRIAPAALAVAARNEVPALRLVLTRADAGATLAQVAAAAHYEIAMRRHLPAAYRHSPAVVRSVQRFAEMAPDVLSTAQGHRGGSAMAGRRDLIDELCQRSRSWMYRGDARSRLLNVLESKAPSRYGSHLRPTPYAGSS